MPFKTKTLYKGTKSRRVGTAKEYRSMLAQGWSETAPKPTPAQTGDQDAAAVPGTPPAEDQAPPASPKPNGGQKPKNQK